MANLLSKATFGSLGINPRRKISLTVYITMEPFLAFPSPEQAKRMDLNVQGYLPRWRSSLPAGTSGPSGTARHALLAIPFESCSDSSDSYNGDDARCFLLERNEVWGLYSDATHEVGRLDFCRSALQAALDAAEGEAITDGARLAESDARVAGKIFFEKILFHDFILMIFFYGPLFLFLFVNSGCAAGSPPAGGERCFYSG